MSTEWVLLLNLTSTWYLTGLIWTIQVVHYRLFGHIGRRGFVQYETAHMRLITPIVAPPMIAELVTSVILVMHSPPEVPRVVCIIGLAAVAAIWASTVFFQVPCHNRLSAGFDRETHYKLVTTNWIRTLLWTARAIVLAFYCGTIMSR